MIGSIEIEARFGQNQGSNFDSGMSKSDFDRVVRMLEATPNVTPSPLLDEHNYIYHQNKSSKRITQTAAGELRADHKEKFANAHFDSLSSQVAYVLRVAASRETILPVPTEIAPSWDRCRHKKRREFRVDGSAWAIHATEVISRSSESKLESASFEVELELPLVADSLTEADTERQLNELNAGISFLLHVIIRARQNADSLTWTPPSHIALEPRRPSMADAAATAEPYVPHANLHPDSYYQRSPNGSRSDSHAKPRSPEGYGSGGGSGQYSDGNTLSASSSGPFAPSSSNNNNHQQQMRSSGDQPLAPHQYVPGTGSSDAFSGIELAPIRGDQARERAIRDFLGQAKQLVRGSGNSGGDFWGTMPISFSRKHMEQVTKEDYFISEKTDGVRYLLAISKSFGVVFVNRSGHYFDVVGFSTLQGFVQEFHDTILDGELVRHQKTQSPYFLLFDCVKVRGSSVAHETLSRRLKAIGQFIGQFRQQFANTQYHPFGILGKTVMPKSKLSSIAAQIATDSEGRRIYTEGDGSKRCHLTDGLIMAPGNVPYTFGTCHTMFKWKYVDLQSIDFLLRFEHPLESHIPPHAAGASHRKVELHINLGGRTTRCKTTELIQSDFEKIFQDLYENRMNARSDGIIAEMAFEPKDSTWRYHRLRTDKKKPNHISIAFDTMEAIAENVTIDDILLAVAAPL